MTVIVALRDRMLCDSCCSTGGTHFPTEKIYRYKGDLLGVAGDDKSIDKFLTWYMGSRKQPLKPEPDDEFDILLLNHSGIFNYGNSSLPNRVLRPYHGIGTGWGPAHAAMMCGKTPREAIEVACEIAEGCGLPVQEFLLNAAT